MICPPEHPFGNGTEEQAWMDVWCGECAKDHSMHDPETADGGCDIFLTYLVKTGDRSDERTYPTEWEDYTEEDGFTLPPAVRCRAFEQCTTCDERSEKVDDKGRTHRQWAMEVRAFVGAVEKR